MALLYRFQSLLLVTLIATLWSCTASPPLSRPLPARVQQFNNTSWRQGQPHQGGSLTGAFRLHAQVPSQHLQHKRDVLVWLPPNYSEASRYPVLYVHDGNNLFDRRTTFGGVEWQLDENARRLIQQQQIHPVIIVGIYNTADRMAEYIWHADTYNGNTHGGKGADYARFLVKELKPFIDQTYSTRPEREHTAIMGSSLGGLISFDTARAYPEVFSKVGMLSPSVWWKDQQAVKDIASLSKNTRVWVDMGTREGQNPDAMLGAAKNFVSGLESAGFEHFKNLAFHIEEGGDHSESAWARRIHRPLSFFYGK